MSQTPLQYQDVLSALRLREGKVVDVAVRQEVGFGELGLTHTVGRLVPMRLPEGSEAYRPLAPHEPTTGLFRIGDDTFLLLLESMNLTFTQGLGDGPKLQASLGTGVSLAITWEDESSWAKPT